METEAKLDSGDGLNGGFVEVEKCYAFFSLPDHIGRMVQRMAVLAEAVLNR